MLTIYVYPITILFSESLIGFFEFRTTPVNCPIPISGKVHHRGPVTLAWYVVKIETPHPELDHNVVYHEFAHKLDMFNGIADGTPIFNCF
jgi:MtfA peptidase